MKIFPAIGDEFIRLGEGVEEGQNGVQSPLKCLDADTVVGVGAGSDGHPGFVAPLSGSCFCGGNFDGKAEDAGINY